MSLSRRTSATNSVFPQQNSNSASDTDKQRELNAWQTKLRASLRQNLAQEKFLLGQLTKIKRNGDMIVQSMIYSDMLLDDPRFLLFSVDHRHSEQMELSPGQLVCISMVMPSTKENYIMYGKAYLALDEHLYHRACKAPKVYDTVPANTFWNTERLRQWTLSSSKARGLYLSTEAKTTTNELNEIKTRDPTLLKMVPTSEEDRKKWTEEDINLHDNALSNYGLFIFVINKIEYESYANWPPHSTTFYASQQN
ncbi:hypothetical protein MP638_003954 [Amoeboaphelidium occidentale]|nr:hypothetical protein MP638_003954 [Amoeboaphelidium occidentale]